MKTFIELASAPSRLPAPFTDPLRLAVAAHLARFKSSSRGHTESDLRCYLAWCAGRRLDPLAARPPHLELYIRWMQEIRRFRPSTVSRRFSVTAGFYRTCVIDGILRHSPAEHVRRPSVPAESPTLGFTHLQSEALLTAARESPNLYDFAPTRRGRKLADHGRGDTQINRFGLVCAEILDAQLAAANAGVASRYQSPMSVRRWNR